MPTLYLIRGLPGSGKSTLAKQLVGRDKVHIEADMWFVDVDGVYTFNPSNLRFAHEWCQDRTKLYLTSGCDVMVSNTSTTEKEVQVYQNIAKDCGAQFVSIIVENCHGSKSVHNVPDETFDKMKNRFSVKL